MAIIKRDNRVMIVLISHDIKHYSFGFQDYSILFFSLLYYLQCMCIFIPLYMAHGL